MMKPTELETRKGQGSRKRYWARVEASDKEMTRQAGREPGRMRMGCLIKHSTQRWGKPTTGGRT